MLFNRLSPQNITNDFVRARFYREVQNGSPDWDSWEVSIGEELSPELVSLRYYGTPALKMIVVIASGVFDMRGSLKVGRPISLPPTRWVRDRIKHYVALERSIDFDEKVVLATEAVSAPASVTQDEAATGSDLLPSEYEVLVL